jgi:XRE family aerobic/anaerobic benzoate catabolism transcriptional regulator
LEATANRKKTGMLEQLAERVRALREVAGLTRAALAERSGLSVRFLARIEGGEGNVSLLRLVSLADALGVAPDELLRFDGADSGVIALVGMRGAGKSTVGPMLAKRRSLPFLEMDAAVQKASGLPIDQIFELHGERFYRRVERETLARILDGGRPTVVAAAGGVVNEPGSWEMLRRRATVVWLRARPEEHWRRVVAQGDRRPMAHRPDALAELRAMLAARERIYAQAHVVVETTGKTPRQVLAAIESGLTKLAHHQEGGRR